MDGCLACDLSEGRRPLPGGLIDEAERWRVEHTVGPLGIGTLIVKPKLHVVRVADLTEEEAMELGPLLRMTAALVTLLVERSRSMSRSGHTPMQRRGISIGSSNP